MSNYTLHPPTPSFVGVQLKTKSGVADIFTKVLNKHWAPINKEGLTGHPLYLVTVIEEAYKAGYQDGMKRPIKDRVKEQKKDCQMKFKVGETVKFVQDNQDALGCTELKIGMTGLIENRDCFCEENDYLVSINELDGDLYYFKEEELELL